MRIAYFSDNFYPALSGIADSIILSARELARQGHEIRFYVPSYAARDFQRAQATASTPDFGERTEVFRLLSIPYPPASEQRRIVIPTGRSYFSLRRWKPDVIHTQLCFGAGIEALLAARFLHVPMVGTSHTPLASYLHFTPFHGPWVTRKLLDYVSWYYNQCAYVTAPSNFMFAEMEEHGFDRPHRAFSNPIDTELFHAPTPETRAALRKEFGITGHAIVYAGRLSPEKHVDTCIQAMPDIRKSVPDAVLLLAGQGSAQQQLTDLAARLGVSDAVRFLGFIDQTQLSRVYQASDVFVIASTVETQCLTMMQAFACGLSTVGVDAGGLPEYLPSSVGFIVPPENPVALAGKLSAILKDDEQRRQLGARALHFVQQYSAPRIAAEWAELYSSNSLRNGLRNSTIQR